MEENLDRILEKLDFILKIAHDYNFTSKRIKSRGESQHISSVSSDYGKKSEVTDEPE